MFARIWTKNHSILNRIRTSFYQLVLSSNPFFKKYSISILIKFSNNVLNNGFELQIEESFLVDFLIEVVTKQFCSFKRYLFHLMKSLMGIDQFAWMKTEVIFKTLKKPCELDSRCNYWFWELFVSLNPSKVSQLVKLKTHLNPKRNKNTSILMLCVKYRKLQVKKILKMKYTQVYVLQYRKGGTFQL